MAPQGDQQQPVHLQRVLNLWEVTASGIGIIIGAGIYVLVGAATAHAGAGVWVAFLLAALLSALTGLSYAELASMYPSAGAEYEYTRQAFWPWLAFVVGWVMIAGLVVAAATVSLGFAAYLSYFIPVDLRVGAVVALLAVTLIALVGVKQSARVSLALSLIQVGGLLLVIATGIPHVGSRSLVDKTSVGGVLSAAALIFFAFIGFDEVITLAEEARDPVRTIPRALLLALGLSALLYIAVALAAISVLGPAALASSEHPLADVLADAVGQRSATIVAVAALVSTFNTALLCITAASRLTYGMASHGALPSLLGRVSRSRGTPTAAILLAAGAALAFVSVGNLTVIAGVTDFAVYLVFLAVHAAVIRLRFTRPHEARPIRVPWSVAGVPVLALLGIASVVLMLTQLERLSVVIGSALTGLGLLIAFVSHQRLGRPRLTAGQAGHGGRHRAHDA